ncbi:MAG: RNA-directed DNA polymerase [Candidatus Pacearchaeota archaeon]
MPLGTLTSQLFANVYLNELDYFVKHTLKAKFYIRYVDDFVILHHSKKKLEEWKEQIDRFLGENLKIELHPNKSRIFPLSRGIDFVGFRNFSKFRLLRKRNMRNIYHKIKAYTNKRVTFGSIFDSCNGWQAYAKWADSYNLRKKLKNEIVSYLFNEYMSV